MYSHERHRPINRNAMSIEQREEITKISKEFANEFKDTIGEIAGSGWLIVDPLSGYLNFCGFENTLQQIPANEHHPLVLFITFSDGSKFIPAGSDLPIIDSKDWAWITKDDVL